MANLSVTGDELFRAVFRASLPQWLLHLTRIIVLCNGTAVPGTASSRATGSRTGAGLGQVGEWSDQWKVLVYDKPCRNIISTLLHVTQLRKQGVTLHMLVRAVISGVVQSINALLRKASAGDSRSLVQHRDYHTFTVCLAKHA